MREKMILDNIGLIYKVMKDNNYHYRDEEDFDEAFCTCLFGLIRGVDTLDNKRNPSTYLYTCIERSLYNLFVRRTRVKRQGFTISINNNIEDTELSYINAIQSEENIEEKVILKDRIEKMLEALDNLKSDRQRYVIKRLYGIGCNEMSACKLSSIENVSFQSLCQTRDAGLKNLRKALKEEK